MRPSRREEESRAAAQAELLARYSSSGASFRSPCGGRPAVIGLLPFALSADGRALIVHASRLARHTAGLAEGAAFDALVHEPVTGDVDPLQVRRVTLRGEVRAFADHDAARTRTVPPTLPSSRRRAHHGAGRLRVLPPRDHRRRLVSGSAGLST